MRKFLLSNWDNYKIIGFDLDGTLYKEKEFIQQVYKEISKYLATLTEKPMQDIYFYMLGRWIEKGSSYPFIYEETIQQFGILNKGEIIKKCLQIYRNFSPNLRLSKNVAKILDIISKEKLIFLVTDGNAVLQRKKFHSLQLQRWFSEENTIFTGELGIKYYKPSVEALKYIRITHIKPKNVLFIGDRNIDVEFAKNAGFDSILVKNFDAFWSD